MIYQLYPQSVLSPVKFRKFFELAFMIQLESGPIYLSPVIFHIDPGVENLGSPGEARAPHARFQLHYDSVLAKVRIEHGKFQKNERLLKQHNMLPSGYD